MAERGRALGTLAAAAALALLAAAVVSLTPAQQAEAQTIVTLVSNTGQTTATENRVAQSTLWVGHGFTTGSNSGGYTLTSIDIDFTRAFASTLGAQLWSATDQGAPNEKITDLEVPDTVMQTGITSLSAPSGTMLAASTTYFVVVRPSAGQTAIATTNSDNEDSGGAAGWTIADGYRTRATSWSTENSIGIKFAVKGYANQAASTTTVASSSTTAASTTTAPTTTPTTVPSTTAPTTTATTTATTTVTTMPASTKTFRIESTKTAAEGGNARLTVTLGEAAPNGGLALSVTYDYSGSTATADDTGTTPTTVTVAATKTTATLTVPIAHDQLVEGDETFTATISTAVSGWTKVSGADEATITITDDDDDTARIAFGNVYTTTAKQTFTVRENVQGGVLTVPIIISENPQSDFTVNVTVETGGTATEYTNAQNPGDFRIQTKSVTFTSTGSRQQNITIAITNDTLLEENQTIELKISDSTSGTLGALYTRHAMGRLAKVTITDDDRSGAQIAFGANPASTSNHTASVDEDVTGGTLNVPVTINRIPESSVTFAVSVLTTTTNPATEYQAGPPEVTGDFRIVTKSVTFGPSDTLSSGTVSKNLAVTINDDDLVEEDQRILVSIGDSATNNLGRHYTRHSSGRRAVVTIEDDEADEAKIAFAIPDLGIPGIPFQGAGSRAEYKGDAAENGASGYWEASVLVSAKPESDITIPITVVSTGTTATSADYSIATASVTFGPNRATQQAIRIAIVNDDLLEEDQTVKLRLAAAGSGLDRFYVRDTAEQDDTDGVSSEATMTILDEERPGKIAFGTNASGTSAYTADVDEDDGIVSVPVTITNLPESNTTFTVEVLETASRPATEYTSSSNPGDYRVLGNKQVTFGPTDADTTENVRVRLNNNSLVEHPETIQLRIVAADTTPDDLGDHYVRHASSRLATLTVADDDAAAAKIALGTNAASTMKFTYGVDEDVTNSTYKIPIKVSHSPSVDTTFEIEVLTGGAAGTATAADYSITTKTFTLTPTTTSATVDVTLTNDQWVEDDQTIEVRIKAADSSGSTLEKYYTRHANGSLGTITIEDDEQRAARVAFGTNAASTSRYTANGEEVVGTLMVPIIINHLPESNTTFAVEVLSAGTTARETADSNNTAGNPRDFGIATKSVMFGPTSDKSMDLTISIDNDMVEEDDEFIVLRIVAADTTVDDLGDHYRRHSAGATSRVTVKSEDAVSKVTLSISASPFAGRYYRVYEGTAATLTATSDIPVGPGGWRVTPSRRTFGVGGSGRAGAGDVRFAPFTIAEGQKTATGTVRFLSDKLTEPQELLLIQARAQRKSRSLDAALSGLTQLGGLYVQILDSGAGATLSTTSLEMVEQEEVTYTIQLNAAPTADVVVTPATSSSARATVSGALTFTSTNWQTAQPVTVTGVADGTATISHTVTSTDTTYSGLSVSNVTAKVLEPAKTFTLAAKGTGASTATGVEGTAVELEVTLDELAPTGGLSMTVTHNIGSTTPSTLTVPVGKRRATLNVAIADDSTPSAAIVTHTVTVSASGWTPKRTGADKVVVSFSDDDGGEAWVAFAASGTTAAPANAYTASVDENVTGGMLNVPVTISALPAEPVTFTVRVLTDSTAKGADFTIATKTVTFAANASDTATTKNLTITLLDDDLVEPDETIRLGFAPARDPARTTGDLYARRPGGNLQAVVTIDSEDKPTSFSIAVVGTGVVQGGQGQEGKPLQITATLDKPADTGGVQITLATTTACPGGAGTNAAAAADYTLPGAFTIPAGDTTATATVQLPRDDAVDGDRSLRLTATANPSLTLDWVYDTAPCLDINIRDIDSPGLTLSETRLDVAAGQSGTYTIRLNTQPANNVTVAIAVDPAANAAVSPTTLTFTTQNWRTPKEVRVRARTLGAAAITATTTSTDTNYNNRTATLALSVTAPTSTPTTGGGGGGGGAGGGGGSSGGGGGGPTGGGGEPAGDEPVGGFSDLDQAGRSHIVAVTNLVSRGVLDRTGCGGGQLCPREPIRRWEMAVWLVRIIDGQDPAQPTEPRFEDVGTDLWWAGHAERLAQLGITLGCSTEPAEYCPDRPVTRAQMASFLVRAFEIAAAEVAGFEDTTNNTHRANIEAIAAAGITLGCATDPPSFCPRDPTTRAQMASFLTRVLATREPTPTG